MTAESGRVTRTVVVVVYADRDMARVFRGATPIAVRVSVGRGWRS
jgi:hypothetical protein